MTDLPKISIITPSFNQAPFIEQTLRSVLDQGYPSLEYIVMDGGSTDGTLDILRRYEGRLTWFSQPDRGQSHALNKGFAIASGEVLAFLNSDDLYQPGALLKVGQFFAAHPQAAWLTGRCRNIDQHGREIRKAVTLYKNLWLRLGGYRTLLVLNFIAQPATFWRRAVMDQVGCLDESLHYTLDYDYWLRIGQRHRLYVLHRDLAAFRLHAASKSGTTASKQFDEELLVARHHAPASVWSSLHFLHNQLIVWLYRTLFSLPHYEE